MGKGSGRRPLAVPQDQFDSEWNRIFSAGDSPPSLTIPISGEIEATREGADQSWPKKKPKDSA